MSYRYEETRVTLRNPRPEEGAVLLRHEYWRFHSAMRFPLTRSTPATDAVLRERFLPRATWTRLMVPTHG